MVDDRIINIPQIYYNKLQREKGAIGKNAKGPIRDVEKCNVVLPEAC